jgi:hypothetical protein
LKNIGLTNQTLNEEHLINVNMNENEEELSNRYSISKNKKTNLSVLSPVFFRKVYYSKL